MSKAYSDTERDYLAAIERLATARKIYATEWQLARRRATSDMMATQATIEKTRDEITLAQAEVKIMERRMENDA